MSEAANFSSFTAICLPEIPKEALQVDLHFPMGEAGARKLLKVHARGSRISADRVDQYRAKGLRFFWIAAADVPAFYSLRPRFPSITREVALCLLEALLAGGSSGESELAFQAARQVIRRWILRPGFQISPAWRDLDSLCATFLHSTHAQRVALYSVIFAMAFEHDDSALLADLMLAGFLHDVGRSAMGLGQSAERSKTISEEAKLGFQNHPANSVRIIEKFSPAVSTRARIWVLQHHERFGGGGFPNGIDGYQVNDLSQLLAAADLLDELASGLWDGECRGLSGAFEALGHLDQQQTFPQYFNPDLFKALLAWFAEASRRTKSRESSTAA